MILRKPYAFLIKRFRLIHLILSLIVAYLIYNTSDILKVYNTYISSKQVSDVANAIGGLSRPLMYVALFIFIVSILTVATVLKIKKKPILMYVINTIITIAVIALYIYAYSTLRIIEVASVDVRLVRVIRDLLMILIGLQSIQFITLFVRATGFDIKKFDFGADLIGLQVTEEDREEVEVSVELDSDVSKRKIINFLRNFKYTFIENKIIFSGLIGILTLILIIFIFVRYTNRIYVYEEKEMFKTNQFAAQIKNSYITNIDSNGNVISDSNKFIIVELSVNALVNNFTLNYGNIYIKDGNRKYFPTQKKDYYFQDLGKGYQNEKISVTEYDNYLIIFNVPNDISNDIYFILNDVLENSESINVKLELNSIDEEKDVRNYQIGDVVSVNDVTYLGGFLISEYSISKEFTNKYTYCTNSVCYEAFYFVVANSLKNYDTVLLKINTKNAIEGDNTSIEQILKNYGRVKYKIGQNEYTYKLELLEPKVKNENEYYIEINSDIQNADEVYLNLNVRNMVYQYKLK